jgi:glucose-6-phosphate 1-epimerase
LADAQLTDDGVAVLELVLPPRADTPLQLTQTLHLGRGLRQSLATRNTGNTPVSLTQALHSYFRVGDSLQVQVRGLEGLRYSDRFDGGQHLQSGAWDLHDPRDPGRSDRTYHQAGPRFVLHDPVLQRRIELEVSGSHALVAWNPGATGVAALGDVAADGWRGFVCLEAANAGEDVIPLQTGQVHVLQQSVHVSPL